MQAVAAEAIPTTQALAKSRQLPLRPLENHPAVAMTAPLKARTSQLPPAEVAARPVATAAITLMRAHLVLRPPIPEPTSLPTTSCARPAAREE